MPENLVSKTAAPGAAAPGAAAHHVVIVGAGFGGLAVAHGLAGAGVRITILDQRNHHLFQPLLYQVGTATLATSEIAWPVRHLVRKRKEITTLLGVVIGVDTRGRAGAAGRRPPTCRSIPW